MRAGIHPLCPCAHVWVGLAEPYLACLDARFDRVVMVMTVPRVLCSVVMLLRKRYKGRHETARDLRLSYGRVWCGVCGGRCPRLEWWSARMAMAQSTTKVAALAGI